MLRRYFLFSFFLFTLFFIPIRIASAEIEIINKGSLNIADKPCYGFLITGLVQLDNLWFNGSYFDKQGQFPNGITIRRFYLGFGGTVKKDWTFLMTASFQPQPERLEGNLVAILRETFVNYSGIEKTNIAFGQIAIPSSLENWSYNSDLFFIDNSLPVGCFFPNNDYGLGMYVDRTFIDTFTLAGAIFQPRTEVILNGQLGLGRSDQLGEALRFTYSPIHTKTCVAHFGLWGRRESFFYTFMGAPIPSQFAFQGYNNVPEALARNTGSLVNTGSLRNRSNFLSGIEIAGLYGPFMFQAEYMGVKVDQIFSNTTPAFPLHTPLWFKGWYVQGSYIFTGESHIYDFPFGIFRRPIPECPWGALEMVMRYSHLDLSDKNILGGVENNFSIGINWYVNNIVRLTGNYIHASAHPSLSSPNGANNTHKRKLGIWVARAQIAF